MRNGLLVLFMAMCAVNVFADEILGIPLRPDPPLAVDGVLGDWSAVPNALALSRPEQVTWGTDHWQSPKDLAGTIRLAWRTECLFVAAKVQDDTLCQTQRGAALWKGDHVELYIDTRPDADTARDTLGLETFQIALSPGNFEHTGNPTVDCPPEAFCYTPREKPMPEVTIAAARTETGWVVEAAIPWAALGVTAPAQGMALRFEAALSDSDSPGMGQESFMTTATAPWARLRSRLRPAVLAGSDGIARETAPAIPLLKEAVIKPEQKQSLSFAAPAVPEGKDAVISLLARLDYPVPAGYTHALHLTLNGTPLGGDRFHARPVKAKSRDGRMTTLAAGENITVFYAPDFGSPDASPSYGLTDGVKACLLEFRVTDLLRADNNVLEFTHTAASIPNPLNLAEVHLEFRTPPPPPKPKAGPPEGPLPSFTPRAALRTEYHWEEQPDAGMRVVVRGEDYDVETQFSTPDGQWDYGSCAYFNLDRRIEQLPEAVVVHDTFTNLRDEPLPLMHRHEIFSASPVKHTWITGLEQTSGAGNTSQAANPTTYVSTETTGAGLLPLDDVFRVHAANYATEERAGLSDNMLVLAPKATYTTEWAIIPTDTPDYWSFLNTARRLLDANFTIDGGFAFLRAEPVTDAWTDQQLQDFIRFKDAHYVCAGIAFPTDRGRSEHGITMQSTPNENVRNAFTRWRGLAPDAKCLIYFHCFIDVLKEGPERFADDRILQSDGTHATYGEAQDRLYLPLSSNRFGREIAGNVEVIFDQIKADGVYWDEHEYSRLLFHYGKPWDGFSGDIDPKTMRVTRLKSSVTLLTEEWRLNLARRILARGPLVGNGPPFTRAMAALKFPCFVETGSISNCIQAQLYSPIALGDHLTERSERDAYGVMLAALDYGCVYHWYNDLNVIPSHPHLTRYMYPITPLELHEGFIIGKERIITKKSGLFGWGDASQHEVHVFDDSGTEVPDAKPAPRGD